MLRVFFISALLALSSGYSIRRSNGTVCSLCVDTLEAVKAATTAEEVEKLVTDLSTMACSMAPKFMQAECQETVTTVISNNFEILREITRIWGPQDLCQLAHLCPKEDDVALEGKVCDVCVDAVSVVRFAINEPAFRKVLETYAEVICKATGPLHFACAKSVDYIMDTVFDKLAAMFKQFEDEDVCRLVHLCPKETFSTDKLLLSNLVAAKSVSLPVSSDMCDVCVSTVDEITEILEMEELEKLIEDTADTICSLLPFMSDTCKEMAENIIEETFYFMKQYLDGTDSKAFCQTIHICPKERPAPIGASQLCGLCEDTLHLYRSVLTDPDTEAMVDTDLKFACHFTGPLHKECEKYAEKFNSLIFGKIRDVFGSFEDHSACVLLDFCPEDGNSTTVCDVCTAGFDEVREIIVSPVTETLIKSELELACKVTGPFSRICTAMVDEGIEMVFKALHYELDDMDGHGICKFLHLCKRH